MPAPGPLDLAVASARTTARHLWGARRSGRYGRDGLSPQAAQWVDEVSRSGFTLVPGFFTQHECEHLIGEIDRLMAEHPEVVQTYSDRRFYGAENGSDAIARFGRHADLHGVAEAILGGPTSLLATLGARLEHAAGNLGSGEGWHRDSQPLQFKAIVYLTDVGPDNGPFQFIEGSQRLDHMVRDMWRAGLGFNQNRLTTEHVDRLVRHRPERLHTVTGAAGTMILVNTAAIHRGKPIESGVRYALTNYYFPQAQLTPKLRAHFQPMLG